MLPVVRGLIRRLILAVFAAGLGLIAAPLLLSSLAVDSHGVLVPGRVVAKSETISVRYTGWRRTTETTIQYEPPDAAGEWFYKVRGTPELYDELHIGDTVQLRYLLRRDIPRVPMADALRQMRALPLVRLAGRKTLSGLRDLMTESVRKTLAIAAGAVLFLIVLRKTKSPLFPWAASLAVAAAFIGAMLYDFPRPTAKPAVSARQTSGTVKSVERIDRIFDGSRSKGFGAEQPVDVVGIEFVPEGRAEPVVAVDLIDAGSAAGLGVGSRVGITYERDKPRTAWMVAGRRDFVSRNVEGILFEAMLGLAVVALGMAGVWWLGRVYTRLVGGKSPRAQK